MREERGADPRPACSAGRTGDPLHAVLVTHPPRLLHARIRRTLGRSKSSAADFSYWPDPAAPGDPTVARPRAPAPLVTRASDSAECREWRRPLQIASRGVQGGG